MDSTTHRNKTISGLKWNLIDQVYSQGLTFLLGIALMRLLNPEQFGLIGMVTVFSGFLNVFSDFGLSTSIIQKKDITDSDKNTIFWMNCLLGSLLTAILFFSSSYLAAFYKEPKLELLAQVLSLSFLLSSLGSIQTALLRKQLSYKKLFIFSVISTTIAGGTAFVMAYMGLGVWALVAQQLLNTGIWSICVWLTTKYFPSIEFSISLLKKHLKFGIPLFGSNTFSYWISNGDNILVGKFLGAQALGLYSRAYTLVTLPTHRLSGMLSTVMFPSFSYISDDKERVQSMYLKISRFMASLIFPLMGILCITAKQVVILLVGVQWMPIIPIIQVLCGVAAIKSINILNNNVLVSQGRTDLDFLLNVISGVFILLCFFIGVQFGIFQVAIAYLIGMLTVIFPAWYFTAKQIECTMQKVIFNILPQLTILVLLSITGVIINNTYFYNSNHIISLAINISVFIIIWIFSIKLFCKNHFTELIQTKNEFLKKKV